MFQMYRLHPRLRLPSQQCRVHVLALVLLVEVVFVFLAAHGSKAQETTPDGSVCGPLLEAADNPATTGNRQQHHFEATCHLKILGHGRQTPGVKSIKLSCHNPSEPDAKVLVGVASATFSSPLFGRNITSVVMQQLDAHGQGIQLVKGRKLACQQEVESPIATSYGSLHGLLYFCQGNIRFLKPVVQDVWLPHEIEDGAVKYNTIVVVAGNASALFQEAAIERNNGGFAIAVRGTGEVEIWDSILEGNSGDFGAGVLIQENAVLRVQNSIFRDHVSRHNGGEWAEHHCSHFKRSNINTDTAT